MKQALRTIERAIKDLYKIDTPYRAENYLIKNIPKKDIGTLDGALFVRSHDGIEVGIYFSPSVREHTRELRLETEMASWTTTQLNTFSVLTEELSHFHYFLFHASRGRAVSQLELEIQAEIDRLMLCFFSCRNRRSAIESLLERLIERSRFRNDLQDTEHSRYETAHHSARRFVTQYLSKMSEPAMQDKLLQFVRRFYRLPNFEKLSILSCG